MPVISKYSQQSQEDLFQKLLNELTVEPIPLDMALMVLGNLASHTLNQEPSQEKRVKLATRFGQILLQTVKSTNE